jgi:hypothetical protein
MKIKTNLHFHTGDDDMDPIDYSTLEGIDKAAELGFGALALTCHQKCAWTEEYFQYAEKKGVLLISGIEIFIGESLANSKRHTLVLNGNKGMENIRTFKELELYKHSHPEIFVIAAHPYFYGHFSLHEMLEKHIGLYDAIEQSWFYSKLFNRNTKGRKIAEKHKLPFVSTSDAHYFDFLDKNYCIIDAPEKTPAALFSALRAGHFENVTSPRNFWLDMVWKQGGFFLKEYIWRKNGGKQAKKVAK